MSDLYSEIALARQQNVDVAICTIVATKGSTPRKMGAKMLVYADGRISGSIGGGNLEKQVIENAKRQIGNNEPSLSTHDLLHQHSMCCGGSVTIYIEPIQKMNRLYIFGAGHTGHALAKFASNLDFNIFVVDDRKEYADQIEIDGVDKLTLDFKTVLPSLPFDENTFIVIVTYEHEIDREILAYCLNQPHAYLGMIGSQRKVELTKKMFVDAGIASIEALEKVDMPMGYNIGAQAPEEIAVSILAKLIEVKNQKTNE